MNTIKYILIFLILFLFSCNPKKSIRMHDNARVENIESNETQIDNNRETPLTPAEINNSILKKYVAGDFIVKTISDHAISYHKNGVISYLYLITRETNNTSDLYYDKEHCKNLSFDENGQLMSLNERIGRQYHGTQLTYYSSTGQVHTISHYNMGNKEGEDILYKMDGSVFISENFIGGKKNGTSVRYNDENKLISKVEYRNGIAVGNSISYYDDGKVNKTCSDGIDFRFCKSFYETGKVSSEMKYNLNTGKLIYSILFDENGKITKESYYDENGNKENNSKVVETFDANGKKMQ